MHSMSSKRSDLSPLVSVVITNYNYANFVEEAVYSVLNQTYDKVECVVVDDLSTDDSYEKIVALRDKNPELKILRNRVNSGQSKSLYEGYLQTSGTYVLFLDADDFLFEDCIETHVMAHLLSRMPVGFTSVDMVQLTPSGAAVLTSQGFSQHVLSQKGRISDLVRPGVLANRRSAISVGADDLHYVAPSDSNYWPWSPTSGNCFRRDALELIIHNTSFHALRTCSDIYLLRAVGALTGSILIDRALAAYRIHATNGFAQHGSLHQVRTYNPEYLTKISKLYTDVMFRLFASRASFFVSRLDSPERLVEAFKTTDRMSPPVDDGHLTDILIEYRHQLKKSLGLLYDSLFVYSITRKREDEIPFNLWTRLHALIGYVICVVFRKSRVVRPRRTRVSSETSSPKLHAFSLADRPLETSIDKLGLSERRLGS